MRRFRWISATIRAATAKRLWRRFTRFRRAASFGRPVLRNALQPAGTRRQILLYHVYALTGLNLPMLTDAISFRMERMQGKSAAGSGGEQRPRKHRQSYGKDEACAVAIREWYTGYSQWKGNNRAGKFLVCCLSMKIHSSCKFIPRYDPIPYFFICLHRVVLLIPNAFAVWARSPSYLSSIRSMRMASSF